MNLETANSIYRELIDSSQFKSGQIGLSVVELPKRGSYCVHVSPYNVLEFDFPQVVQIIVWNFATFGDYETVFTRYNKRLVFVIRSRTEVGMFG